MASWIHLSEALKDFDRIQRIHKSDKLLSFYFDHKKIKSLGYQQDHRRKLSCQLCVNFYHFYGVFSLSHF